MIIYIDMDDVLCDYTGAHSAALTRHPAMPFPQSQYGFFAGLSPKQGAIEAAKSLLSSDMYEPYILTAPSVMNPLCYTEKRLWVEQHLGFEYVERLIISPNKGLLRGDILIDDHTSGMGQESFQGRLILFGSESFPDWRHVMAELMV